MVGRDDGGQYSESAMRHPFWTPPSARSRVLPCFVRKLAVDSLPDYCRRGVPEGDARTEGIALTRKFTWTVTKIRNNKTKTHHSTKFGTAVWTLAYDANYGRIALNLGFR